MPDPTIFSVPDISCDHCVGAITEHVGAVSGVTAVDVDLSSKTVAVIGGVHDAIVAAIDDAGFDVA